MILALLPTANLFSKKKNSCDICKKFSKSYEENFVVATNNFIQKKNMKKYFLKMDSIYIISNKSFIYFD